MDIALTPFLSSPHFWSWFWLIAYVLTVLLSISIVIWADITQRRLEPYMTLSGVIYLAATVISFIVKAVRVL